MGAGDFVAFCKPLVDGDDAHPVGYHDVLPLANDAKPDLLKGPNGIEMIDARKFGHA